MDEEIRQLALDVADSVYRKVRREMRTSTVAGLGKMVAVGADGTPTKYIDEVAEAAALRVVKKSKLAVDVVSEEAGLVENGGDWRLVLDPVDGTRNLLRGIPFYSVSVAIGHESLSDLEFGVVRNIVTGERFIAEKGKGAFLDQKRLVVPEVPLPERLMSVRLGVGCGEQALSLASVGKIRSLGATSLELCLVASDAFDVLFWGSHSMRVVDIAAGVLMVREAGGVVMDVEGNELDMELSLDERTSVVAGCSEELVREVIGVA